MVPYNHKVIYNDCKIVAEKLASKLEDFRDKTILITGANGLVGGFLADFFTYINSELKIDCELQLTSLSDAKDAERVQKALSYSNVQYFSWDLSKPIPGEKMKPFDYVFFCAGYGQPKKFIQNKMSTMFLNTAGVDSILDYCSHQNKNCKFMYLSSSEIYGSPDLENIPTSESYSGNYSVESNRACYISAKRLGEVICLERGRSHSNITTRIARLALAYGPGVLNNDDRVMQEFMFKAKKEKKIHLLDDGSALRNYIYIADCAEMLINITLSGKDNIYNVGGEGDQVSILDLANKIASMFDASVTCGTKKSEAVIAAPNRVALDLSKYNSEFGQVQHTVRMTEGLKRLSQWLSS